MIRAVIILKNTGKDDLVLVTSEIRDRIRICVNSCQFENSYCGACRFYTVEESKCRFCDYCVKHQAHSGKGHNYPFDSCLKCKEETT